MVKTVMSSDVSEPEESDTLAKAKEKLRIQQSLINSSARTLLRLNESTTRLISTSYINGLTNGERESAIDDDIKLQEVGGPVMLLASIGDGCMHAHVSGWLLVYWSSAVALY